MSLLEKSEYRGHEIEVYGFSPGGGRAGVKAYVFKLNQGPSDHPDQTPPGFRSLRRTIIRETLDEAMAVARESIWREP